MEDLVPSREEQGEFALFNFVGEFTHSVNS